MEKNSAEIVNAGKFVFVGVINTLLDMGIFAILAQLLAMDVYFSQLISFSAGVLNSYIINRSWTFRSKDSFFSPTLIRFLILNIAMLMISTAMIWLFYSRMGIHKMVAKVISTCGTLVISFLINRIWVFRT